MSQSEIRKDAATSTEPSEFIVPKYTFDVFPISWQKPQQLVRENKQAIDEEEIEKSEVEFILYQIYGFHPVYGSDVLLYIGRTKREDYRKKEHQSVKFERGLNLSFRKGTLSFMNDFSLDHKQAILSKCESLLIASMKPAYNSAGLMNSIFINQGAPFMLQNCDHRGVLPLECSSIWWNNPFRDSTASTKS